MFQMMKQLHRKFYSHVNYSVTKIVKFVIAWVHQFYSHVNYSVTKILQVVFHPLLLFYSHVNYSVTKMRSRRKKLTPRFTVT